MPQLVIVAPGGGEQTLALQGDQFILGRDPNVSIPLEDRKVSRRHARIFQRSNAYWIEDMGSANGVLITGTPITGPRQLFTGTEFEIGPFHLTYYDDQEYDGEPFSLVGLSDPCRDQTFLLPMGELTIGRVDGNAIVVPDTSVSRQHAILTVTGGVAIVEDLDSRNGTWVRGSRVGRRELAPGDRVRFGNVEFEFDGPSTSGQTVGLTGGETWLKLAIGMGIVMVALLVITIVLAVRHRGRAAAPSTGALEQVYEQQLTAGLASAQQHVHSEAWAEAMAAFQLVLDKDPINTQARNGLMAAQSAQEHRRAIESARIALSQQRADQALQYVAGIPTNAHYGPQAAQLAQQARGMIADAALIEATAACKSGNWQLCHQKAVLHQSNRPTSVKGQALVTEAESALRARNIAFTPWSPPATAPAPGVPAPAPGVAPAPGAAESIETRYPDPEVREAAARYAAGDLDTAVKRARALGNRPGGAELSAGLATFRKAKTSGDGAAIAGDVPRAVKAWEEALTADAKILPAQNPSAFRTELQRRLGVELFRQGDTLFNRGEFVQAFAIWSNGLRYDRSNTDILAGMAKLEVRAEKMFSQLASFTTLDAQACDSLRDILSMTRQNTEVYGKAQAKRQGCR